MKILGGDHINMKKLFLIAVVSLLSIFSLTGCSGGGGSSSSGGNPGSATIAFSRSSAVVTLNSTTDLTLSLSGGNSSGVLFSLSSSDTTIAQVSPPNCRLSSPPGTPSSCQLTISGIGIGSARITASAPGFNSIFAVVTVQNTPVPGALIFSKTTESVAAGSNNHVTLSLVNASAESIVAQIASSDNTVLTTTPTSCTLSSGALNSCEISLNGQTAGNVTVTATTSGATTPATMAVNVSQMGAIVLGTIAFDKTSIVVAPGSSLLDQLSLNNSSGVVNDTVTLTSSNTSVATVAPSTCTLSSDVSLRSCAVYIKGISSGVAQITATSIYSGYTYSITPVVVNVTSALNFSTTVKGISQTVYSAQNYNAQFIFTNNTGGTVNLGTMVITNTGNKISSPINPAPCSNITLINGGTCTIAINNISLPANQLLAQLNFLLTTTTNGSYTYSMDIGAVPNIPNYAAFRIVNTNNPGHQGWLVALGNNGAGQAVVKFTSSSSGALLGALLPQSDSYAIGQIQIPSTPFGLVVYQPNYQGGAGNGIGGLMYVSLDNPVYESAGNIGVNPTNPSDPNVDVNYSIYEPNVYNSAAGTFLANLDVTAINFYGVMQGFYATDINTNINTNPGFLVNAYENVPTTTIYSQIKSNLTSSWPNNWGSESQFAFNTMSPTQWVGLKGLVNWIGQNPSIYPTGFNSATYTQYVDDLWVYYAQSGHHILIDADEISQGCVLEATVNSSTTMLVKPQAGSSCPVSGSTGPNTFTWTTFQPVDFVGGAPGSWSTLYGANGTYRSMGKYVSAAQSVGFLPYCSNTNFVYGPTAFGNPANQANYWTAQYDCLDHYSTPGGYGNSVMNQYDKILHQYVPLIYAWAYDDALGISSEVDIDPTKSVFTLVMQQFNP